MPSIHRITLFKVPDLENQKKLLDAYQKLSQDQEKNGKPYILHARAGLAKDDPRSKGVTVVSKTEFASLDDMRYFDNECKAHAAIKAVAKDLGLSEPPLMVFFEGEPTAAA